MHISAACCEKLECFHFVGAKMRLHLLLAITLSKVLLLAVVSRITTALDSGQEPTCQSVVYCNGEPGGLLWTTQEMQLFNDSKHFVDLPMKYTEETVLLKFEELSNSSTGKELTKSEMQSFLTKFFEGDPQADIQAASEEDDTTPTKFLQNIADPELERMARDLIQLWKLLIRKSNPAVAEKPSQHSAIALPSVFVVPGGRFREVYYWDSYWAILGLLASGKNKTAHSFVDNFLALVRKYGFVPNGARVYYTQRSQPPMLMSMVDAVLAKSSSGLRRNTLKEWLPVLEKEHFYWLHNRSVDVLKSGTVHRLARYCADSSSPRPESFREDLATATDLPPDKASQLFRNIASAAESGWDFSSRWLDSPDSSLRSMKTCQIIPVDLNSILCFNEKKLSIFFNLTGDAEKSAFYQQLASQREKAIDDVFWNSHLALWTDWHLDRKEQNGEYYASTFLPLWSGCSQARSDLSWQRRFLESLQRMGVLSFPAGLPTSLHHSGQQWDFPNGWPPLQWFAVKALLSAPLTDMQTAGFDLMQKWVTTCWTAWNVTGHMYEKYNVSSHGIAGGGGEYDVQVGFGWTNGVILDFLNNYGEKLTAQPQQKSRKTTGHISTTTIIAIVLPTATIVISVLFFQRLWLCRSNTGSGELSRRSPPDYHPINSKHD